MQGFLHYRFTGLIFGEGKTWRGIFSEFYGVFGKKRVSVKRGPDTCGWRMRMGKCAG